MIKCGSRTRARSANLCVERERGGGGGIITKQSPGYKKSHGGEGVSQLSRLVA